MRAYSTAYPLSKNDGYIQFPTILSDLHIQFESAVPETATMISMTMGICAAGLAGIRRRRATV